MIKTHNQCDICQGRTKCFYCKNESRPRKPLTMIDMYYCGGQFVELSIKDGEIIVKPIDRSIIKDIGSLVTMESYENRPYYNPFGYINKTYLDVLGDDLDRIVVSRTFNHILVCYTVKGSSNGKGCNEGCNQVKHEEFPECVS